MKTHTPKGKSSSERSRERRKRIKESEALTEEAKCNDRLRKAKAREKVRTDPKKKKENS